MTKISLFSILSALALIEFASSASAPCVGTISSLDDVADAVKCTTVNLNSFVVPAGQGLTLSLVTGTTVNMNGDIAFGNMSWAGPLFTGISVNGNGRFFDGGGPFYWDGLGDNGGVQKPDPMMKIKISGIYSDVKVINSPARVYSVSNPAPLVMTDLIIDNSQGDLPNAQSNGLAAGHNTDGFDCSTTNLVIQNSVIHNQDDCLAINKGSNIVFQNNTCINGHGISVGSIDSNVVVSGILISGNNIINNDQALRIKTKAVATNSTVTNITYSGNVATGIRQFGIIIDQSYPDTLNTPGTGVVISDVNFAPPQSVITVNSDADQIAVNCGVGSCTGTWDWSNLQVIGGVIGPINNFTGILGFQET
ncbi:endo-polygalacturonase PG1 [Panaeolus papilionaceus]|nr:endo-polygalacturonase PG1 [Panaeolus papilionaceus]